MSESAPHLVCSDEASSLWKSLLHHLAHRLAPHTRDAIATNTRCLERTAGQLRVAANAAELDAWIRAGHLGAIEGALASLSDGAVALAFVPVDDVAALHSDPSYTFATFVTSPANAAARDRARAFAKLRGGAGQAILFHGPLAAGKTHLLRAIAAARAERSPAASSLLRSGEQLSLELVAAIRADEIEQFRARLASAGALLVDDVHALAGREATQEELVGALDALSARGVPVALTSARPTERTAGLIEPLRERLAAIEAIEVRPAEWETRVAIVQARSRRWGVEPSPAVATFLAGRSRANLGGLDGVLTRLLGRSSSTRSLEDVDVVRHLLSDAADRLERVTPEDVLTAVSRHFNVRLRELYSTSRSPRITTPRQIAMYLVRRHCGLSYPEIGRRFRRHHTTALHSDRVVQEHLAENASLRAAVLLVEKELARISEEGG
jgi:chromosomal replication initiator protein